MTPKIIVPLKSRTWSELKPKLEQLTPQVDLVEIWLDQLFMDLLRQPQLIPQIATYWQELKKDLDCKVLAVCKTPAEHGLFGGTPGQRLEILQAFLQLGGDYVDLDVLQNHSDLLRQVDSARLWCSLHDFVGVPSDLEKHVRDMRTRQPAVYKFAVTPQTEAELENFINFAAEFSKDHTAIFTTMGAFGASGRERLKPYTWGAFYALNTTETTASGQLTLADL